MPFRGLDTVEIEVRKDNKTIAFPTHFDFTTQSDTTQLTQSHHNCVDIWACRTASATSPYIDEES